MSKFFKATLEDRTSAYLRKTDVQAVEEVDSESCSVYMRPNGETIFTLAMSASTVMGMLEPHLVRGADKDCEEED